MHQNYLLDLQRPNEMRVFESRRSNLNDRLRNGVGEEHDGNDTAFHPRRRHGVCDLVGTYRDHDSTERLQPVRNDNKPSGLQDCQYAKHSTPQDHLLRLTNGETPVPISQSLAWYPQGLVLYICHWMTAAIALRIAPMK